MYCYQSITPRSLYGHVVYPCSQIDKRSTDTMKASRSFPGNAIFSRISLFIPAGTLEGPSSATAPFFCITNWLEKMSNFGYAFGFFPFRIAEDEETKDLAIKTSRLHKVISI